ncbi:voltage-gated chloride channel family protein [Cytophagaceae bacterium ABcell3]|nr:voltage-gated chloride channel family protein [Cytophagaceae bacterium ABcell3]
MSKFDFVPKPIKYSEFYPLTVFVVKWVVICVLVGILAGSASAFFLYSLEWAGNWRENNIWIISLLPLGGFAVGMLYYHFGREVEAGNNLIIEQIQTPKKPIQFIMAPLVLFGTIVTHFFGGSAGREGTAVQMGGALADQFTKLFRLRPRDRKILLVCGVSAGFASVFGTPLAGAIFGLEFILIGRMRYEALVPSFFAAIIADYVTTLWGAHHTHYAVPELLLLDPGTLLYAIIAGVAFGFCGRLFSLSMHFCSKMFKKIKFPPLRPVLGGVIVAVAVYAIGTTKYIGLGVPVIEQSFHDQLPPYDFLVKLAFTVVTLGAGFKGGEVTPLFFLGATLGNALHLFIPLPMALLAAMGFVAVFAGASNTPLACMMMGLELFGMDAGIYIGVACVVSYLFSGHSGIYNSQVIGSTKHIFFGREKGERLGSVAEIRKKKKKDNNSACGSEVVNL